MNDLLHYYFGQVILAACSLLVSVLLVPALKKLSEYLHVHMTAKELTNVQVIAGMAVKMAEQILGSDANLGNKKMAVAIDFAKTLASKWGIDLSDEEWRATIEQAVFDLKRFWTVLPLESDSTTTVTGTTVQGTVETTSAPPAQPALILPPS